MLAPLLRSGFPLLLTAFLSLGSDTLSAAETCPNGPLCALHRFSIPAQPLSQALLAFSRQSGLAVLASSELDLARDAPPLDGEMAAREALEYLLRDSGLTFRQVNDQGLVLVPAPVKASRREPVTADEEKKPYLDEVVVVASKRRTNLQETPMTVTAIGAKQLQAYRADSLFKLAELVPSLAATRNGDHTASMLYLRGIGSDNYTEAGDSGVATHIDGIYSSRSQGSSALLYDLDRVEVLRGPQGTLFGRNATAGVINYHTARPEAEAFSRFSATFGNYQRRKLNGVVNLPLAGEWALRAAFASDEADGYTEPARGSRFVKSSDRYNNTDRLGVRLSSSWQVNDGINWWASYERFEDRGAGSLPAADHDTPVLLDTPGATDLAQDTVRSRLHWTLENGVGLTYIAGYSRMHRSQIWDGDRSGALGSETDPLQYHQSNHTVWAHHRSVQHELQLKSSDDVPLRWLIAYFDFAEHNDIRFDLEHQSPDGSGWGGAPSHSFQQPDRGSRLSAVYGQVDIDLPHRWQLSAGARSGRDRRYDRGGRNIGCPDLIRSDRGGVLGEVAVNQDSAAEGQCFVTNYNDVSQSWNSTTVMARLSYHLNEQALLYLLYAEGFKPGIVQDGGSLAGAYTGTDDPAYRTALTELIATNNSDDPDARAYVEPETSANLELGFKLSFLGNAMTLNGALFNTRYRDLQVSGVTVDNFGFERIHSTNAASATIRGMELELNWATSLSGRLSGFLSLLDARYDHFLAIDNDFPGYGQTWNPSTGNAEIPDQVDFSGNQLKQAPELSFALHYTHSVTVPDVARFTSRLGVRYSDRVYFDEANREQRSGLLLDNSSGLWVEDPNGPAAIVDYQPAYWMWDASVRIEPPAGHWWMELYGENLTDELVRYDVQTPEVSQPEFYLAPPRTFGLRLGVEL
ncbi:TonB-dependent receptor domain-containing protein [Microbulbifer thermotolerans]|uniref:TonB-dependent receptor domain-containing protein n=1 Tax=Microbulbifer thermotolerans TaxID=252514 RepID=UPI0022492121|nr:TonB-dependent receptor [Microbulbifer thermotolerans]MCX2830338.1 TonB-dependent receptor [Microbulbifer thermotolerans]